MEQLRLDEEKQRLERKKESDRVSSFGHFNLKDLFLDLERYFKARRRDEEAKE